MPLKVITVVPQKPKPGTGSQTGCENEAKTPPPAAAASQPGRARGADGEDRGRRAVAVLLCRRAAAQKQRSRVKTEATKSNLSRGKVGSRYLTQTRKVAKVQRVSLKDNNEYRMKTSGTLVHMNSGMISRYSSYA